MIPCTQLAFLKYIKETDSTTIHHSHHNYTPGNIGLVSSFKTKLPLTLPMTTLVNVSLTTAKKVTNNLCG